MKHIFTLATLVFATSCFGQEVCPNVHDINSNGTIDIEDFLSILGLFADVDVDEDGVWDSQDDCLDATACNYLASPTEPCAFLDALGQCGGACEGDGDGDGICDDVDTCVGELDECGVCNGPGPTEVVIEDITILYDSVYLPQLEEWYVYEFGADTTFSFECVPEFTCGDPVGYHGYDYETVEIGEQCWFAENLRSVEYQNGDGLDVEIETPAWLSSSSGSTGVYGFGGIDCDDEYEPLACDDSWSLEAYGRLYDWAAVADNRGVCPTGWHVSSDLDWQQLELQLGMIEDDLDHCGYRGTNAISDQLKCSEVWPSGNNISGFSAKPAGRRQASQDIDLGYWLAGRITNWWVTGAEEESNRAVHMDTQGIYRGCGPDSPYKNMFSIRCVKDSE